MSALTPAGLRAHAFTHSLLPRLPLQATIERLGFVQADPIRAPARAQDLILMQRVRGYRAGELERLYPALDVEEDYFPNYGFVSRRVWTLLHPRSAGRGTAIIEAQVPGLIARVLEEVQAAGELHPRRAGELFGRTRVGNYWGGGSNASTRALEALHHAGQVRVVRREAGIKVFGPPAAHPSSLNHDALNPATLNPAGTLTQAERLRELVLVLARLYAPASETGLRQLVGLSHYGAPGQLAALRATLAAMMKDGSLTRATVDGLPYVFPADMFPADMDPQGADLPAGVRLLAPFDPLVWDRRRFEHLHGWSYRFEAYTKPENRVMGYYALPLFLAERALGWANLSVKDGALQSEVELVPGVRRTGRFERALEAELGRYRAFLGLAGPG